MEEQRHRTLYVYDAPICVKTETKNAFSYAGICIKYFWKDIRNCSIFSEDKDKRETYHSLCIFFTVWIPPPPAMSMYL